MNICSKPDPQTDAEDSRQYAGSEYQSADDHLEDEGVDRLTGVFDRAHFEVLMDEEFGAGEGFVLILLDLDEIRRLNGAHGRRKGDGALALVARSLSSNARRVDLVARYGDDEFAVLMPAASLVAARDFFERVRTEVAESSQRDLGLTVRLSAGAVRSLGDPGEPRGLLETADNAMHVAKRQGRDQLFATVAVRSSEKDEGAGQEGA